MTCVYLSNKLWWYLNIYLKPVDEVNTYGEISERIVVCEMCIHTCIKWCYTQFYTDLASLIKDAHTGILFWDWHDSVTYLIKRRKAELIRAKRTTYINLKLQHLYLNVQNTLVSSWTIAAAEGENKFIALQIVRVGKIFFLSPLTAYFSYCLLQLAFPVLNAGYFVYRRICHED